MSAPVPAPQPVQLTAADIAVLTGLPQSAEDQGLATKALDLGDAQAKLDSTDPAARVASRQKLQAAAQESGMGGGVVSARFALNAASRRR